MNKELLDYIQDPENDLSNFNLGLWYESQKQLSPASSFFLRCAELTVNEDLEYECFLKLYFCYRNISNRDNTCECLLKNALKIKPKNPETYFLLSQFYEHSHKWLDCYLYACLGLELTNKVPSNLKTETGYKSDYMLIFQKAIAAWWIGKPKESRVLLQKIKNEYLEKIDENYKNTIQKNLCQLGSGNDNESTVRHKKDTSKLRFQFKDSDKIQTNFSQVCQDLFVLAVLEGKNNGTYLEIGAAHPFKNNNTFLLEQFGWTGLGVEINPDLVKMHQEHRLNKCICVDALTLNYQKILRENFPQKNIDYLQLDIEPPRNTFQVLLSIPFEEYIFNVITYEHDFYVDLGGNYREKSRRYLESMGYILVLNDVAPNEGSNFEDWWVNKKLANNEVVKKIMENKKEINLIKEVMFV